MHERTNKEETLRSRTSLPAAAVLAVALCLSPAGRAGLVYHFQESAGVVVAEAATWAISTPGDQTIRLIMREDAAAVDALVFQLSSLPAPSGSGPPESDLVPAPATFAPAGEER